MTDTTPTAENDTKTDAPAVEEEGDGRAEEEYGFAEDPSFEIDYKGDCAYEVKVKVPVANTVKESDEMYEELKKEAEIPGFRTGRAPRKLVERKFAKAVRGRVQGKLVGAAFEKLVKDEDLKPLGFPDIDGLDEAAERGEDDPLEFTLKFEVSVRVELGKYRGVEVERPVVTVEDRDVEEALSEMLSRYATYEELEGGVAADGDQVVIDFKGTAEGEEFKGGSAENYPYVVGSKRFFPEFEEILLGSGPGDDLECTVSFPEDYFAEELRGKEGKFSIKVHEVKRKKVPEITDDFAKELGHENAGELREKIQGQLVETSENRSKQLAEARALSVVVADSTFEIPQSIIERIGSDYEEEEVRRLMGMRVPAAKIEEERETIAARCRKNAVANIQNLATLNEIGEAEGIEVTDDDFEKEAAVISQSVGAEAEAVAQYMSQDENRNSYADRIYRSKAMAIIMDNANVVDKELSREELESEESEESREESKEDPTEEED